MAWAARLPAMPTAHDAVNDKESRKNPLANRSARSAVCQRMVAWACG
jgi:hypothetical protein